jgi:diguanylate cyclase (GGDEF)-like protein/PAS domain S-box-containing protein
MLGYAREELLGMDVKRISHPEDRDLTDEIRSQLRTGRIGHFRVEKRYLRKDGSTVWVGLTTTVKRAASGDPQYDIAVFEDITSRKHAEARIQHLATHDALTGLPNRVLFSQLLDREIESARRHRREFAVLFIDLDGFKAINDGDGHDAGDRLLQEISARLKDTLRSSDVVARLGGDEFVALLPELCDENEAGIVAGRILRAVVDPVAITGRERRVTASIGISKYPDSACDARSLMKNADTAMYLAKQGGKNDFRFYPEIDAAAGLPSRVRIARR